jgi:hypothetical protein
LEVALHFVVAVNIRVLRLGIELVYVLDQLMMILLLELALIVVVGGPIAQQLLDLRLHLWAAIIATMLALGLALIALVTLQGTVLQLGRVPL